MLRKWAVRMIGRRTLFRIAAVGAGTIALLEYTDRKTALAVTAPFLPYTADSFYKSRVSSAPVNQARTDAFHTFMKTFADQKGIAFPYINGLSGSSWGTVYAEGNATDPIWHLSGTLSSKVSSVLGVGKQGFHAPAYLGDILTGTSDSPFCVLDRASGYTVFGTKASKGGTSTINVGSGGITYHSSNGLNGTNPKTNDKRNFTSRGRISDAMVIRRDTVDAAIAGGTGLGHVLHLFIAESKSADGYCHPMTGAESSKVGFGAEGERIAIKPSVDLTTRNLSPFGLAVARTLQQNGAYIGDNAGRMSTLKAQQTNSHQNPWAGLTVSQTALKGLTWDDFVVIERGWQ
jgi:hypothetical protein